MAEENSVTMPVLGSLLTVTPEEFKGILDANSGALDHKSFVDCAALAREFLEDNFLYTLAPTSRLGYIQEKIRGKGLKDFQQVDSHIIAAMMQFVYKLDMSCSAQTGLEMLVQPFVFEEVRKSGAISVDKDGFFSTNETYLKEIEEKLSNALGEDKLAELKEALEELVTDKQTGEISGSSLDANIEHMDFGFHGHSVIPKAIEQNVETMRQKYIEKFGDAKLGKYMCPVDKGIVDFCRTVYVQETGLKLPEARILIDYEGHNPHTTDEGIVVPAVCLTDKLALLQCIMAELPHIGSAHLRLVENFKKDKGEDFKETAWEEGVPLRLQEVCIEAYVSRHYRGVDPKQVAYSAIDGIAKQGIILTPFLHPHFLKTHGVETALEFSVYNGMAYSYGWHFVRKLDGETFKKLLQSKRPWNSKELGWNRKMRNEDRKQLEKHYEIRRKSTVERFGPVLGEDLPLLEKAFDKWRKDYLT